MRFTRTIRTLTVGTALALIASGCGGGGGGGTDEDGLGDPGDCTVIDTAVSSEKIDLMKDLARDFNGSEAAELSGGGCAFVRPFSKASGGAAELLAEEWRGDSNPQPVIWSPAASSWGAILNQRLAQAGKPEMAGKAVSFMLTPLVIAMPKPMAEALGWPDAKIGWSDVAALATSPDGWAAKGHPEWGKFKLGKTNPNFSTSGLSALIGQTYAATGKTRDLSSEDLKAKKTIEFSQDVESAVVHYGDITMTFLNNWFRTDRSGTSLNYASAVAVEEKSVIDYNQGNPDGVLDPGEQVRKPRIPLVAIYPKEGTLYSDNPLYVLDAPWVDADEKEGAAKFIDFVQLAPNQRKVLRYGFRPGNPDVAVGSPITAANGVDAKQPSKLLQVPDPPVMISLLDLWKRQRKDARVLLVLDVSGSMEDPTDPDDLGGPSKLELAKKAAVESLGEFKSTDDVGLRIFSTNLGPNEDQDYLDLLDIQPMKANREALSRRIRDLFPTNGTPLYTVTSDSYDEMVSGYDPTRINAVVLLTDGANDDGNDYDDEEQLRSLIQKLQANNNNENDKPVRVFAIGYGTEANHQVLEQIAEASNAAYYSASDPETITKVFTSVISNF
ncbi:MAG: substrate-binding domain-containing protein [Acidimicrobiales bacterium]|nr:substrate-binding domain-containing protein [Acidimicrobiales bacterium]